MHTMEFFSLGKSLTTQICTKLRRQEKMFSDVCGITYKEILN